MLGTVGFAFLAGLLSVLSPCVLPLIPIVLGTAAAEHRLGPVALAAGLAVAFTAIGLFVATIGFTVGLDGDVFRRAGAVLLVLLGAVLMLPRLQARVATAASPIGAFANFDEYDGNRDGALAPDEYPLHIIVRGDTNGDERLSRAEFDAGKRRLGQEFFGPPTQSEQRGLPRRGPPPGGRRFN